MSKLKVSEDYIEFIYSYLIKVDGLEENYSKLRLAYLLQSNPLFLKDTLSFKEYEAVEMSEFIIGDLEDNLDLINNTQGELKELSFEIQILESDINYVYESLQRKHREYLPYVFPENIIMALLSNHKALFVTKGRELKNDDYFQDALMANIQYQLVGRQSPPPCANARIKREYYALFENLAKR